LVKPISGRTCGYGPVMMAASNGRSCIADVKGSQLMIGVRSSIRGTTRLCQGFKPPGGLHEATELIPVRLIDILPCCVHLLLRNSPPGRVETSQRAQ